MLMRVSRTVRPSRLEVVNDGEEQDDESAVQENNQLKIKH